MTDAQQLRVYYIYISYPLVEYLVDDPCPHGYAIFDKLASDAAAFISVMMGETAATCAYSCDCEAGDKWAAVRECTDTSQTRKFCTSKFHIYLYFL